MPRRSVREFVEFNGERYYRDNDDYFKASRSRGRGLLHRDIWASIHGPIPPKWDVHHKDENRLNNDPSNLEALSRAEHKRRHGCTGAWARSTEDRSRGATEWWATKEPKQYFCAQCDVEYWSKSNKPTKFCSQLCGKRYRSRARR